MRKLLYGFLLFLITGTGLFSWSYFIEPTLLRLRQVDVAAQNWPESRPPLRVAVIADLHVGCGRVGLDMVDRVVKGTMAQKPELILIAGDFVCTHTVLSKTIAPEAIAARLKTLSAPLGVIAVIGNHDNFYGNVKVRRAIEAVGITVLENAHIVVGDGDRRLVIAGVEDDTTASPDVAKALAGKPGGLPVLIMMHDPANWPSVPKEAVIAIAGHTHGGQVRIPFYGPVTNASRAPLRHSYGLIHEKGKLLYVSGGIGMSILPIRFNNPPEHAILTIRHGAAPTAAR